MSVTENESRVIVDDIDNSHMHHNSVDREGCSNTEQRCSKIVEVNLVPDMNEHLAMIKKNCRICYLSMDMTNENNESRTATPIELGCMCKNDLAIAHKQCAETWFKIKGNITCEICGSIARNVVGVVEVQMIEQLNGTSNINASMVPSTGAILPAETQQFWRGHRFSNSLFVSMLFSLVIFWIFHIYFSSLN